MQLTSSIDALIVLQTVMATHDMSQCTIIVNGSIHQPMFKNQRKAYLNGR